MLTVPSVSQHKPKYNPVLKNGRSGTGQVVQNNLDSTVCVIEIQVFGNLFNNLEVAAHPLPTVPPCQPASLPACQPRICNLRPLPPCRTRPGHGTNLRHQPAVQVSIKPLTQISSLSFNFSNFKFKFQLFKFQV